MISEIPVWAVFCTLRFRAPARLSLEVPTNSPRRARLLRRTLGYGRCEGGKVIFEGDSMTGALIALGFPDEIRAQYAAYRQTFGSRGVELDQADLDKRCLAAARVKEAYIIALKGLKNRQK